MKCKAVIAALLLMVLAIGVATDGYARSVHVHGYYRKNGTYVHSHSRSSPHHRSSSSHTSSYHYHPDSDAPRHPSRSHEMRQTFVLTHPCPSTGTITATCPGYQVDHIQALENGGADFPSNMRWLSVEEHRQKTRLDNAEARNKQPSDQPSILGYLGRLWNQVTGDTEKSQPAIPVHKPQQITPAPSKSNAVTPEANTQLTESEMFICLGQLTSG